jgi:hypothetical protein
MRYFANPKKIGKIRFPSTNFPVVIMVQLASQPNCSQPNLRLTKLEINGLKVVTSWSQEVKLDLQSRTRSMPN